MQYDLCKEGAPYMFAAILQTGQPDKLSQYYYDAYPIYRKYCPTQYFIVAPEIFYEIPGTYRQHFMDNSSYTKVLQDIHECVPGNPNCMPALCRGSALGDKMPIVLRCITRRDCHPSVLCSHAVLFETLSP